MTSLALSPDEKMVIALIGEPAQATKNTIVPDFVTESAYTEDIGSRNKVGDLQARIRIALIGVADGEVEVGGSRTAVARACPNARTPSLGNAGAAGHNRRASRDPATAGAQELALMHPRMVGSGTRAFIVARSADNKDRWILALDPATGKTRVIVTEHDDAWIGGPGGFGGFGGGDVHCRSVG